MADEKMCTRCGEGAIFEDGLCWDCIVQEQAEQVDEAEQCVNDPPRRTGQPCPKTNPVCFFCGEPATAHRDRWHHKTRKRLTTVHVCDEHFTAPPIPRVD